MEASEAFAQLIWHNPEVCNNCFRRCKEVSSGEYRDANTGEMHSVEDHQRTEDGDIGYALRSPEAWSRAKDTAQPRTTCKECGSVGLIAEDDDHSTEELLMRTRRIAERLQENDCDVNVSRMCKWVRVAKSVSVLSGFDREVLAGAVEIGVRNA
jgi:hypothetical protein